MNKDIFLFIRQMARSPAGVGAVAPSSRALGRLMASYIDVDAGPVVEIGSGTGAITRQILAAGIAPENLSLFEMNPDFCTRLKQQFQGVAVHNEMAQKMPELGLSNLGAIVSGLPLLNMPNEVQRDIANSVFSALKPGAPLIQFTYGPKPPLAQEIREELGLVHEKTRLIWFNLPPATVYVFRQNTAL